MKFFAGFVFWVACILMVHSVNAQDTLPAFTVVNRNGKVILSWVNNFPVVKQMSIQRSSDSLKGFKTILTLPDPTSVTNGFLDNNAPDTVSFYKLYILLDSGKYLFSKSQKPKRPVPPPVVKSAAPDKTPSPAQERPSAPAKETAAQNDHQIPAKEPGNATAGITAVIAAEQSEKKEMPVAAVPKPVAPLPVEETPPSKTYERESIKTLNKKRSDGLSLNDSITQVTKAQVYKPSSFIFTNSEGNVTIVLPAGKQSHFKIKFLEEDGSDLFQLNSIREQIVIIDKSNFMRSGWFRFELYEDDALKEKNKIFIPKDTAIR
ncbi:MAG: hypothetical protein KF746_18830 [Chitinophagaceae bacterium]|nr:hypothetical protein [Chitinophagaceae bacterium]